MDQSGSCTPGIGKGYGAKKGGTKGKEKGKEKGWKGYKLPDIVYDNKSLTGRMKVDYKPDPTVASWGPNQIAILRTQYNIEVLVTKGEVDHVPSPVDRLSLMSGRLDALKEDMKIQKPTPIQMQVWPAAMSGRDIIGVAPTGSGKTLAYMVPMLEHCQAQLEPKNKSTASGPIALILVPNVDLARQIKSTFDKFRNTTRRWLKMALAVPGEDLTDKDHYHILVASPGRLLDLLCNQTTTSFFELTTYVVVDEADFLLKKAKDGSNQTLEILSQLRPDIQMLCFTATWDEDLPKEIGKILKPADWREPLVEVIVNGKTLSACRNVQQYFLRHTNGEPDQDAAEKQESRNFNKYWMEDDTKDDALYRLLDVTVKVARETDPGNSKTLVFANTLKMVDHVYQMLVEKKFPVTKLTGETNRWERNTIVTSFADPNQADYLILVTTDMLGRGIDFNTCRYVLLYEFPDHSNCVRDYVHRIGRTGRAGRQGFSCTLLDESAGDFKQCQHIVNVLKASGQKVPQWMIDESKRRRHHWNIYESLRKRSEPSTPPAASTGPTAASGVDVDQFATRRVQRVYGSCLAEVNIPCSPMYDLEGFCQDRALLMVSMENERKFPIVF